MPANRADRVAVRKYLLRYAEPEARIASQLKLDHRYVLVVPVRGEPAEFLRGYAPAIHAASGPVLVIVVVNADDEASPDVRRCHAALLDRAHACAWLTVEVPTRSASITTVGLLADFDALLAAAAGDGTRSSPQLDSVAGGGPGSSVLVIDRARGAPFGPKQGVGLARRIGCDVALASWARGRVQSDFIACTDADVRLPAAYFRQLDEAAQLRSPASSLLDPLSSVPTQPPSGVLFDFRHTLPVNAQGDERLAVATTLYELRLRYYVLGLAWAGSPYAYHSMGSAIAVHAEDYAKVRGFPQRQAGEDFHLLDKLAKVGPLWRAETVLTIDARRSNRVPFGTGPEVSKIEQRLELDQQPTLYDPECFVVVRAVLVGLARYAERGQRDAFWSALQTLSAPCRDAARDFLNQLRVEEVLHGALQQVSEGRAAGPLLARRLVTWFDALKTLRCIHAVRDSARPNLSWLQALERAPFVRTDAEPEIALRHACEAERLLPRWVGPTLPLRSVAA